LLAHYSAGKTILNTFCYTGGFSVYALQAEAANICSVDISERAVQLAAENATLDSTGKNHTTIAADIPKISEKQQGSV